MSNGRIFKGDEPELAERLRQLKRVAVLGIKTEQQADQPAFYVPKYLVDVGIEVIPVPTYYPEVTHILGVPVVRRLAEISGPVEVVDIFRRAKDLPGHLDDILQLHPRMVWLQRGISDNGFAEQLSAKGIDVVQDRCLMEEHRHAMQTSGSSHP